MADTKLSSKSTITTISGGYVHIISPDGGSPTGFTSYRIAITDLQAGLQSQISANASDIMTLQLDVVALENISSREQFKAQTSNFQFSQPADSNITMMTFKSFIGGSVKVGTSAGDDDIMELVTLTTSDDTDLTFDSKLYSRSARTVYFTITGTVSANVYYTKSEYE